MMETRTLPFKYRINHFFSVFELRVGSFVRAHRRRLSKTDRISTGS